MKKYLMTAATCLSLTHVNAGSLNKNDQAFIYVSVQTLLVLTACPDYETVEGGLGKIANDVGATPIVVNSVMENIKEALGQRHQSGIMVEDVTEEMRGVLEKYKPQTHDTARFCQFYSPDLIELGTIKRRDVRK